MLQVSWPDMLTKAQSQTRYETLKEQSICPEEEYRYSSTLSLTSAIDGVGGQRHAPAAAPPGKRTGTHSSGTWVCPRAQNLVPHWKCTCNHKYLFCDAPPTRVGSYSPPSGKLTRRNTFITNAVQDVYMYSQNTWSFEVLQKCIKRRLHLFCIY